ncbi:MAG TPA: hypothetical protein DCK95_04545 [Anaerolineaceae bacterium]|nr:hypothetical protein [Anaerolineaceae bacterium]
MVNEMNQLLQPNLESAMSQFYVSQEPEPVFAAHLEERLRQRQRELVSQKRKFRFSFADKRRAMIQKLRAQPILAFFFAILSLAAITGIVYALGRLTGFIPGFGFTSEGEIVYVLAEPVESSAGGNTLHGDQAGRGEDQFWVELTVEGDGLSEWEDFSKAFVQQPDHEPVEFRTSGSSGIIENEVELSYSFPPLVNQPQEVTLLIEDLYGQDFAISLELEPVEEGEVVPVPAEASILQKSESHQGVQLVLDNVAVNSEKTIFQVSLHYDQPHTWVIGPWNVTLSDEKGSLYPLTDITPTTMHSEDTHIYKTIPFDGTEKLVLTLATFPPSDSLSLFTDFSEDSPSFTFDAGENPEIGQLWKLNHALSAGSFDLKVISATLTDEPGLVFEIETGPSVSGARFYSTDPLVTGSTGGIPVHNGNITAGLTFSGMPEQPLEIQLMGVYYQAKGTWQIHWQPPAAPPQDMTAPTRTVAPTMLPLPSATPITGNPLLLEVKQLADKYDAPFQKGPGWVHVVQETTSDPRAGQTYPPAYLKSEQWYEIDREGYVTRIVWLDYNSDGQIIQQSATVGDYSINFTTGDSGLNNGLRYRFSLDIVTQSLSKADQNGTQVLRENSKCEDGRPCLLITMQNNFASAVQNPGEEQAFSGTGQRAWIDLETGQQVKHQSFWLLEDGSESVISTKSTVLVEKVSNPPQKILDILEKVIMVP